MEHNRAAATTWIFQPEAASAPGISSEATEGDGDIPLAVAPVVPKSCSVTILSSPRFSSVGSNLPKNRALLQTGWVHCSASGERKGKECKTRWGYVRNKNAAGNTFHFIWAVIPSCAPSSVLILPSVFSCLLPKTGDFQAKAFSQQAEPGVQGEIVYSGVSCSRR